MTDWKEVHIERYLSLEREKRLMDEMMATDPAISKLGAEIEASKEQLTALESGYKERIRSYETQMQDLKDEIKEGWDIQDKKFKCDTGSATIRTTRSLKVDNQELLIGILQHFGKLTQCIKSWDLTYLRKLGDADLFEGSDVIHYDEKRNVIISSVKKESDRDEEEL